MSKLPGQSWWSSIGFGAKARPRDEDDFGDMGTAFGLDASLGGEPPGAADTPRGEDEAERAPRQATGRR